MNELRKYATFSVDLTTKPVKVNSMFSLGRARIFYIGTNINRSIIEGEAAYNLAASIPGTPIIGLYNYDTEDFEGHGEGQSAFGFVPLMPNPTWVKIDENGKEREYLEVDVVVWDGRFEEAKNILSDNKSLSMELNPATLKGSMVKRGEHMYYNITHAEFAGITVLGEDVEPCFKDAGFLNAYSHMVSEYAKFMSNIQEHEEGGISQMENIDEVKVEEVVEPEVTTETVVEEITQEETISTEEVIDTPVLENETEVEEEVEVESTENEVIAEESENETEFACGKKKTQCAKCGDDKTKCAKCGEDKTKCACGDKKTKNEKCDDGSCDDDGEDEKECPECGENPCVCKNSCGNKKDKYSLIIAELEAKNESLTQELNAAHEALNKYTRQEKLEIISKFSTKLENGEELIASLTEKVDELTKEEIKAELGNALVEQIEAEEVVEETEEVSSNFSLNINVNNEIGNTAWDLVKRYKANK